MKIIRLFLIAQFILIIGFIIMVNGNNTNANQKAIDIKKMAKVIDENNGTIIEWSLYARDSVYFPLSGNEWLTQKDKLEDQFPTMKWTAFTESGKDSIVGFIDHGPFSETIKMLSIDKNGQTSTYVIYEARGADWNSDIANSLSELSNDKIDLLFEGKPVIFSCIKGEFNEELNEFLHLSLDEFLHTLQATEIESVKEREFYSISVYTSLFAQILSLPNTKMNMQIGLRKNEMGTGTIFVVGTPIITIEY